jgi:hypothetical protein
MLLMSMKERMNGSFFMDALIKIQGLRIKVQGLYNKHSVQIGNLKH